MRWNWRAGLLSVIFAAAILLTESLASAQGGAPAGGAAGAAAAASSMSRDIARDTSPLNPENSLDLLEAADHLEEKSYREFKGISPENMAKKIDLGEQFLKRYQHSKYRAVVYSGLAVAYLMTNQVQKMEAAGEQAVALNPKDVQMLAMLGQTIPRVITANTPDSQNRLEKAEEYCKRAIGMIPTIAKPTGVDDQEFTQAKNQTLAIAHSGLGMVNYRRGDYAGSIAELDQSVKLDPRGDATNYYVLGVANYNTKHFSDAAKAFSQCAQFSGNLQAICKDSAEKAKNLAAPLSDDPE